MSLLRSFHHYRKCKYGFNYGTFSLSLTSGFPKPVISYNTLNIQSYLKTQHINCWNWVISLFLKMISSFRVWCQQHISHMLWQGLVEPRCCTGSSLLQQSVRTKELWWPIVVILTVKSFPVLATCRILVAQQFVVSFVGFCVSQCINTFQYYHANTFRMCCDLVEIS